MGFGLCWDGGRSIACLEVGLQRGFEWETLGEPSTFELWQTGDNMRVCSFKILNFGLTTLSTLGGFHDEIPKSCKYVFLFTLV